MLPARSARLVFALAALFLTQPGATHASAEAPDYRGPSGRPPVDPLADLEPGERLAPPVLGVPSVCGPREEARAPYREFETCSFVNVSCPHKRSDDDWTAWWRANSAPFLNLPSQLHAEFDVVHGIGHCGLGRLLSR